MQITTSKIGLFFKEGYFKKRKNNNKNTLIRNQEAKINRNINNYNNWTHLVGPSFSGETYLMLKIRSWIPHRDIDTTTKSPPEQYFNTEVKTKEVGEEISHLNQNEKAIIVFDDVLGSTKSKYIDLFLMRGRHNNLDILYLSQSYFDLPKRTIRKKSEKIFLFTQRLKDLENLHRDVGGYDTSYGEFKQSCRKSWVDEYNYLCFDRSKKSDQGTYCNCIETKTHKSIAPLKQRLFVYLKCCFLFKVEKIWKNQTS